MIAFLAPPPDSGMLDGYLARVKHVDQFFSKHERVYLSFNAEIRTSFRSREVNNLTVIELSPYCQDARKIAKLCLKESEVIYIHSIYQARNHFKTLLSLSRKKIIFDTHGVVPEEMDFMGSWVKSKLYSKLEERIVFLSAELIFVSDSMKNYWRTKYPTIESKKTRVAPIISIKSNRQGFASKAATYEAGERIAVYAGGSQKWQNVELMAEIVNSTTGAKFEIYTFDQTSFCNAGLICSDRVTMSKKSADEVAEALSASHFSMVLRDDHILNRVSCPTKYVEALATGNIPIVKSEALGDFKALGAVTINETVFRKGCFPTTSEFLAAIQKNQKILAQLEEQTNLELFGLTNAIPESNKSIKLPTPKKISVTPLKKLYRLLLSCEEFFLAIFG